MTDSPDRPDLSPEQEAVRRLLADARHDDGAPPEVVAHLDATLAALATERAAAPSPAPPTTGPVVDLGARRRRTAGIGLLAAAAVVVAGVAIGNGLPSTSGGSDDSSASSAGGGTSRELGDSSAGGAAEDGMSQQPKTQLSPGLVDLPQLSTSSADLDDDLLVLRDTAQGSSLAGESARAVACDVPGIGRGRQVVADVDGVPGLVVFRRADGTSQRVDLYVCGDPTAVRTLTLPAP